MKRKQSCRDEKPVLDVSMTCWALGCDVTAIRQTSSTELMAVSQPSMMLMDACDGQVINRKGLQLWRWIQVHIWPTVLLSNVYQDTMVAACGKIIHLVTKCLSLRRQKVLVDSQYFLHRTSPVVLKVLNIPFIEHLQWFSISPLQNISSGVKLSTMLQPPPPIEW